MVETRSYLIVFVGKSYTKESKIIVGISHLQTLCLSYDQSLNELLSKP